MKKLIGTIITAFVMAQALYASDYQRPDGLYVGGFGGLNWLNTYSTRPRFDSETGYSFSTAIGYRWMDQFRFELEYAYRYNTIKSAMGRSKDTLITSKQAYLFNTLWDLPFCETWSFKPFLGGGIGFNKIQGRYTVSEGRYWRHRMNNKASGFAWQIIAGVAYPISKSVDISFEYRLFKGSFSLYNHCIGTGLKYHF